jgi:hypothetical protein
MRAHRYRHYGLGMESNLELDGLVESADGPVDLALEFVRADSCPAVGPPWVMIDPPRTAWRAPGPTGSRLRLQFHGTGGEWAEFRIEHGGRQVVVALAEQVDLAEALELLLGSVFSCVFMQRGVTCLHASVVAFGDRAFAFVGPRGAGKSTLALALVQRGARLVSDDVAVLTERDGVVAVAAGRARLRIGEDSADTLAGSYARLRPMWVEEDSRPRKRYYDAARGRPGEAATPVALAGVFLLAPRGGGPVRVRALAPGELLPRLSANRHMASLQDRAGHRRDFARLASIAAGVPARELLRPHDLSAAATAADAVLCDIAAVAGRLLPDWQARNMAAPQCGPGEKHDER